MTRRFAVALNVLPTTVFAVFAVFTVGTTTWLLTWTGTTACIAAAAATSSGWSLLINVVRPFKKFENATVTTWFTSAVATAAVGLWVGFSGSYVHRAAGFVKSVALNNL